MRLIHSTYPTRSLASPFARSPWMGLEGDLDRLFQSALGDFVATPAADRFPVDLYEDNDNTYVRAELPGVNRDDIGVELTDGYLTISAARKSKTGDKEESFSFTRSVTVPDNAVDADKITASYENGVVTVILPKREETKPRKVTVTVK